jgi:hypothetical protein
MSTEVVVVTLDCWAQIAAAEAMIAAMNLFTSSG